MVMIMVMVMMMIAADDDNGDDDDDIYDYDTCVRPGHVSGRKILEIVPPGYHFEGRMGERT